MSWGGEAGDCHITNIWSHGFINTYSFTHASKTRLEGLCRHLDSLDHVVYYKITRDETGETLYEVTKENEFARRYFSGIESGTGKSKRGNHKVRSRDSVHRGTSSGDKRTSRRSAGGSKQKSEEA